MTLHYAQTLDGRIAALNGSSKWISGEESLQLAHRLRAEHDAVMIGVGTVLADDPQLTVRLAPGRSPHRVVVDSTLRLPLTCRLLTDGEVATTVATTARAPSDRRRALRELGCHVVVVAQDDHGRVDLHELLRLLVDGGVESVLVEGGSSLITSVLRHRLADRVIVCVAPKLLGRGIDAVGDLGIHDLADALTFSEVRTSRLGRDMIIDGRL